MRCWRRPIATCSGGLHRNCSNTTTSILSSTLSTELIRTIRNKLPNLTSSIQGNIATLQQELYALGDDMPEGRGAMVHAIIELCGKVQEEYKQIINHVRQPGGGEACLCVLSGCASQGCRQAFMLPSWARPFFHLSVLAPCAERRSCWCAGPRRWRARVAGVRGAAAAGAQRAAVCAAAEHPVRQAHHSGQRRVPAFPRGARERLPRPHQGGREAHGAAGGCRR